MNPVFPGQSPYLMDTKCPVCGAFALQHDPRLIPPALICRHCHATLPTGGMDHFVPNEAVQEQALEAGDDIPADLLWRINDEMPTRHGADGGGAGGFGGDAFPGEEPQAIEDRNQRLDVDNREAWNEPESYNFVYANGQLHISDGHDHHELAQHSGIAPDHTGPMAVGKVTVDMGKATFSIQTNVSAQGLARIFKDYCKDVGWIWGGMTDLEGEPVGTGSEFAPAKSHYLTWDLPRNELEISKLANSSSKSILHVLGSRAYLRGQLPPEALDSLFAFTEEHGLTLYGGNDNVLRTIEDLQTDNNYSPEWNDAEDHFLFDDPPDERKPGGVYSCPNCGRIFPNWGLYLLHRKTEDNGTPDDTAEEKFPQLNDDATFPPNTSEPLKFYEGANLSPAQVVLVPNEYGDFDHEDFGWRRPVIWDYKTNRVGLGKPGDYHSTVAEHMGFDSESSRGIHGWISVPNEHGDDLPQGYGLRLRTNNPSSIPHVRRALIPHEPYAEDDLQDLDHENLNVWTGATIPDPKDMIQAPIPFLYDIQEDQIITGQPGQRQSDIPGHFTPGGIVEGLYEPGGAVVIRSMTNMPYSVRHMLELWTYQHPHMEIRNVNLQDDEGKRTKLASQDIGSYIKTLAAADPAAWRAYKALKGAGGKIYVVGGAVRDALMGKEPNDIDLMVTGLPPEDVGHVLANLPGRMDLTGKDFGVFRYNSGGFEVEVALPRRERSTGIDVDRNQGLDVQADHTMTPEEDLFRRDFTANAMAVDLDNGQLIDPFDGSTDVRKRQLRTLNTKSLGDDPLRTLRALTALSKHGLYPTDETKAQMQEFAPELKRLPQERIQMELDKLFKGDNPGEAMRLGQDTGVLPFVFPEVSATHGWTQNNPHHELELFDHLINVADRAKERKPDDPDFVLAGLLHDIGKKDSHWTECRDCDWKADGHYDTCPNCGSQNTSGHFYKLSLPDGTSVGQNHEDVSADLARTRLNALKYPKERINRIVDLAQHHMFPAFNSEKGARKFLNKVGPHADDLLHLRWADQGGKSEYPTDPSLSVDKQMGLINTVRAQGVPTNKSMLAINGNDLIAAGIPPSPQMGQIIDYLTEQVLENPELNTKEALLGLAQGWKPT